MANEYLQRTPTSTGNRKVWTFSAWVKRSNTGGTNILFEATTDGTSNRSLLRYNSTSDFLELSDSSSGANNTLSTKSRRDASSWIHIMRVLDTTSGKDTVYVNGILDFTRTATTNADGLLNGSGVPHFIGHTTVFSQDFKGEMFDVFFIDGQALTPDVFGFYKQGKGYISAGSTQATDFRPGQWVPKTPRVIKTEINRRGGFGVNGFYLPMNDSSNFGADFHCDPNSIITLNEKLPQPRVGVASTASVGLGYTDVLRADPYAANLVLALPFVSGGLQGGLGDYSAAIKGSGSAKSITNTGVSIASTASYYGSGSYFDSGNYLSTPNVSDFQFGTGDFTMEAWTYSFSGSWSIVAAQGTTGDAGRTVFAISNTGQVVSQIGSQSLISSAGIATSAQWNHIAFVRKNGVGTIYLNGVSVGINTVYTNSIQNTTLYVGSDQGWTNTSSKMYIQDLRVYKSVAKYTGGFDVPRPYTPVGIATWRQVSDTTANNFATLNPLQKAVNANDPGDFTDGNLTVTYDTSTNHGTTTSNVGIGTTGKWYVEARINSITISGGFGLNVGVTGIGRSNASGAVGFSEVGVAYENTGVKRVLTVVAGSSTTSLYGSSYTTGDIIGIGVSNGGLTFYKNGTSQGIAYTGITTFISNGLTDDLFFGCCDLTTAAGGAISWNFGQNPTFSGNTTAGTFTDSNGKGLFKYQPPSGFLALCEDNLPTPAISDPGKYFKTVLYTGDGNNGRSIVGVGFTPDLVWVKARSAAYGHVLFDSVRGPVYLLPFSTGGDNSAGSLGWASGGGLSMLSDGFTVAYGSNESINNSGTTHVAWCWRAGAGTTTTNTNGSITSVVSVNQDAGFSIVSWVSDATTSVKTMGHGLGKTPSFIITKNRDLVDNWITYHSSFPQPSTQYVYLNSNGSINSSAPSTATLSTQRCIAYCWAEIEGFSKFGSFTGNASTDGPFIWTGFLPAWIMIKRTAGAADWVIHDSSRTSTNPSDTILRPNTSDIDLTASTLNIDFLSNGFKIRNTNASYNNAETYIFAAFAQSPFQTANSK
jgi:hypothetical protein